MRGVLVAVIALSVAACGGAADAAGRSAAVDTVGGVERWSYTAEPIGALGWTADTAAILGDAFAEDEYQFGDVSQPGLAGDAAGNVYILDRQGARVLKYGADGGHLATYGRRGEGPGELSQPFSVDLGPGDTVWVADFSNRRLTGYPQDGGEPRSIAYAESRGFPEPSFAATADGFIHSFRPMGAAEAGGPVRIPVVRLDRALEPLDTLWSIPEPPYDLVQLDLGQARIMMRMSRQFAPPLLWAAFSDSGIVVSDTSAYLLRLIDTDGTLRRIIERGPPPRSVTEADRQLVRQRMRAAEGVGGTRVTIGGGGPDEETRRRMLEERLDKMTFADVVPRVVSVRVDPLDNIWVGVAEEVPDSIARIDIYERDGTLIGELRGVPMPEVFVGEDRIGVLRKDELDVQQVVLLALSRQPPPS